MPPGRVDSLSLEKSADSSHSSSKKYERNQMGWGYTGSRGSCVIRAFGGIEDFFLRLLAERAEFEAMAAQ